MAERVHAIPGTWRSRGVFSGTDRTEQSIRESAGRAREQRAAPGGATSLSFQASRRQGAHGNMLGIVI